MKIVALYGKIVKRETTYHLVGDKWLKINKAGAESREANMSKNKLFRMILIIIVFLFAGKIAFSEAGEAQKISPAEKGYTYNLKELIEQARENIEKVDRQLEEKRIEECNKEREAQARKYFEQGNEFYSQGKLKEAKKQWQEALKITANPEMKEYIALNEKRAAEKKIARRKEERELECRKKEAEKQAGEAEQKTRQLIAERKKRAEIKKDKILENLYKEAKNLYKKEEYTKAMIMFNEVISEDASDGKYTKLAESYLDKISKQKTTRK